MATDSRINGGPISAMRIVLLLLSLGATVSCSLGGADGGRRLEEAAPAAEGSATGCKESDRRALLAFKSDVFVSGDWFSSWTGEDCCRWRGVACDGNAAGHVTGLDLYGSQIAGDIPQSLANLTRLVYLNLSSNDISGRIPESLGGLLNLEELRLSKNNVSGQILQSIGNLQSLRLLSLDGNSITGQIPSSMAELCNLEVLDLSGNHIDGELTNLLDGLSNCPGGAKLSSLILQGNNLSGVIPPSLGYLSQLRDLCLSSNSLRGNITEAHFAKLGKLYNFDISYNSLDVILPNDWIPPFDAFTIDMRHCRLKNSAFPNWIRNQTNLTFLFLSGVGLSGDLPTWLSKFQFGDLDLSSNQLTGPIPSLASSCRWLDLSNNSFSGPLPVDFADHFSPYILSLSHNRLNGTISPRLCRMTTLELLDLSHNDLSGEIPDCNNSTYPTNLVHLHLNDNKFSGEFPSLLERFVQLAVLDLGENKFSGEIPTWVGSFRYLTVLRLSSNLFHGGVPVSIGVLAHLQVVDLSSNNLSGGVPSSLGNLSAMMPQLTNGSELVVFEDYVARINITAKGSSLVYSSVLRFAMSIDLSNNNLSGEIPEELTNLLGLDFLNLARNHLTGRIPQRIGVMKLQSLDLSTNNLTGEIPSSLSTLSFLSHLNLSHNNLSGKIPTGGQLTILDDPSIYVGNEDLCGAPLPACPRDEGPPEPEEEDGGDKLERILNYAFVVLGFLVGFWVSLGTIIVKKSVRFALFRLMDETHDWFYVRLSLAYAKLKAKFMAKD